MCTCCITASPPPRFLGANPELPTRSSVRWCQPSRRYSGPTAWTARHISCHDPCPKLQRRNHHSKFWRRTAPRLLPCESDTGLSVVNVPFERNTGWYVSLCKVCALLRAERDYAVWPLLLRNDESIYRTVLELWLFPYQLGWSKIHTQANELIQMS